MLEKAGARQKSTSSSQHKLHRLVRTLSAAIRFKSSWSITCCSCQIDLVSKRSTSASSCWPSVRRKWSYPFPSRDPSLSMLPWRFAVRTGTRWRQLSRSAGSSVTVYSHRCSTFTASCEKTGLRQTQSHSFLQLSHRRNPSSRPSLPCAFLTAHSTRWSRKSN